MANKFDIEAITALALGKVNPKTFRDKVEPGTYKGVASVDVEYDLRVGSDYTQRCSPRVPWKALALCLASKVNDDTLSAVLSKALSDGDARSTLEEATKPRVDIAMACLTAKENMTYKGKVTGTVTIVESNIIDVSAEIQQRDIG
jgi:hypothetical protein|tara:strand:+ start:4335 stop:4769 length:435 start_codon:yes stop_codon:yes gene_type:complete